MAILFALQVNLTAPICVGLCGHLHMYVQAVYVSVRTPGNTLIFTAGWTQGTRLWQPGNCIQLH